MCGSICTPRSTTDSPQSAGNDADEEVFQQLVEFIRGAGKGTDVRGAATAVGLFARRPGITVCGRIIGYP